MTWLGTMSKWCRTGEGLRWVSYLCCSSRLFSSFILSLSCSFSCSCCFAPCADVTGSERPTRRVSTSSTINTRLIMTCANILQCYFSISWASCTILYIQCKCDRPPSLSLINLSVVTWDSQRIVRRCICTFGMLCIMCTCTCTCPSHRKVDGF